ncbi:transcriptional regulator KdgR [bacterium BMS3Abin05]|nr:transcriptional regulator KdgR [bacterium BMS3Abin05]GBE27236.1 transcriptional regulator KdgR [bacterium BMS3Bbin03]
MVFLYMKQLPNNSIFRAFRILFFMAEHTSDLGITEIANALGIHKSTIYRFLASMEQLGVVQQNPETNKYRLGLALFELGNRVPIKRGLVDKIHPHLENLAQQVHEIVNLAGLFHNEVLYLDKIEAHRRIQIKTFIGFHVPPHCAALGKVILAFMNPSDVDHILDEEGLPKRTEKTITDRSLLLRELEKIRTRHYAIDDEEFEEGLRCVAVPLFDMQDNIMASISISGPTARIHRKTIPKLVEALNNTVDIIQKSLKFERV